MKIGRRVVLFLLLSCLAGSLAAEEWSSAVDLSPSGADRAASRSEANLADGATIDEVANTKPGFFSRMYHKTTGVFSRKKTTKPGAPIKKSSYDAAKEKASADGNGSQVRTVNDWLKLPRPELGK